MPSIAMRRRGDPPMHGGRRGPTTTGSRQGVSPSTPGGRGGLRPIDGNNGTNGNHVQNGNQVKNGLFMKRGERRKKTKLKEEHKAQKKYGSIQMMKMKIIKVHKQWTVMKTNLQRSRRRKRVGANR